MPHQDAGALRRAVGEEDQPHLHGLASLIA